MDLDGIVSRALAAFRAAGDAASLENAKAKFLGKQGELTALQGTLKSASPEERKTLGARFNAACCGASRVVSQPGDSWPHDVQSSDSRPCSKCSRASCPWSPQMNWRTWSAVRAMTPLWAADAEFV